MLEVKNVQALRVAPTPDFGRKWGAHGTLCKEDRSDLIDSFHFAEDDRCPNYIDVMDSINVIKYIY